MRVLVVAPQPFYSERGTPIAVRLLTATLAELGWEVDLLTYPLGDDIDIPGVRILRAGGVAGISRVPIGFSLNKLLLDARLAGRMLRTVRQRRYDVVHAVEESIFIALAMRRFHKASVVYDMDSSLTDQMREQHRRVSVFLPFVAPAERWALRHADRIIAVCRDLADRAIAVRGAREVHVLEDIPVAAARKGSTSETLRDITGSDAPIALYVGNLENYQGIDLLVDAVALLPDDVPLQTVVIGGNRSHLSHYREQVRTRGLQQRIFFAGPRPLDQLSSFLEQADVLLSPRTRGTNTPLKIFSYMAAGRAILATRLRTHTQVLSAQTALLVEPDAERFSTGLQQLAGDSSLRQRLADAARHVVESQYSMEAFREKLRCAYEGLGGPGGHRPSSDRNGPRLPLVVARCSSAWKPERV